MPRCGGRAPWQEAAQRCRDRLSEAPVNSWRAESSGSDPLCPGWRESRGPGCWIPDCAYQSVTEPQKEEGTHLLFSLCHLLDSRGRHAPTLPWDLQAVFLSVSEGGR